MHVINVLQMFMILIKYLMITIITVTGFLIIAYVSFFFTGHVNIKAEPFFERTFSYTHIAIGILAFILMAIIVYRILNYIIYSPMSLYDAYKKKQLIKSEQTAVEYYAKYIGFGNDKLGYRAKDDYKALMSTLNERAMYWLLWFNISTELPNEYESSIFQNKSVYSVYVYKKVKYLIDNHNYIQAIDLLLSIQDFAKDFTWYYDNLIECYLNTKMIDKAYAIYEYRRKYIGADAKNEAKICLARANLNDQNQLQYVKKAYDLMKATQCKNELLAYVNVLMSMNEHEEIVHIIKEYVKKHTWTEELHDIIRQLQYAMQNYNAFLEIIECVYNKTESFQLFCAEMYIKMERYSDAIDILTIVLNTHINERAICMLIYIDEMGKSDKKHTELLKKIFKHDEVKNL